MGGVHEREEVWVTGESVLRKSMASAPELVARSEARSAASVSAAGVSPTTRVEKDGESRSEVGA